MLPGRPGWGYPRGVTGSTQTRLGFASLREGGLNWDAFPLRLFAKGNAKFWDPADLDFSRDAADWQALNSEQRRSSTFLVAQFAAGEEAVTQDIQPFVRAMEAEGRIGDEMYLTQFCFEEAKHLQVFRLWMDSVGLTSDLHPYVADNPFYRQLFYDELPNSLRLLESDPSPANQVRASVTYNHVIEGSLALTGYYAWQKVCTTRGILPGMQELVRRIGDDERRPAMEKVFKALRLEVDEAGSIVDASVVRAHQDASGGKGGSNAILWAVLEEVFQPSSTPSRTSKGVRSTSR